MSEFSKGYQEMQARLSERWEKFAQVNAERVQAGHEPMGWREFVQEENYFARMIRISQGWTGKS